jgi:poly(3-hydroxybutyrate) depolymerase
VKGLSLLVPLCATLSACGSIRTPEGQQPSSGCASPTATAGVSSGSIDVAGVTRTYVVSIPSVQPGKAHPLVFTFHGAGDTGDNFRKWSGFESANAGRAIMVYPDGLDNVWPNTNGRDVAFFDALLARLQQTACVDSARVFGTGFSYGGYMSNTLGCARAGVVRAIAPFSGGGPGGTCNGKQLATWIVHGAQDLTVELSSGEASRDRWRQINHCGADPLQVDPSPCVVYGCDEGYPVAWCAFQGVHTIPSWGPGAALDFFLGF